MAEPSTKKAKNVEGPFQDSGPSTGGISVVGVDISKGMLEVMRRKDEEAGLEATVHAETGDCCAYLVCAAHKFYFTRIMPLIGAGISKDKAAYRYLPASVLNFPNPEDWTATMQKAGFADVRHRPLSLGICNLFTGTRK